MNEALILEKLDNLSSEIRSLKSEVHAMKEAKQVHASSAQTDQSPQLPVLATYAGKYNEQDLDLLIENVLVSVNDINSILFKLRAGNELLRDIEPIAHQVYPHVIRFFAELEGQLTFDDLVVLLRRLVTSVPALSDALGFLKSGMELTDEIIPIAQLVYPKVIKYFNDLEGQVTLDEVVALVTNVLTAVPAINDAVGFLKSGMELKDELIPIAQILYPKAIKLFNDLQVFMEQSRGLIKVASTAANSARQFTLTDTQAAEISKIIEGIDFNTIKPVSPIGAVRQLMDPDVQKSLGAAFMMLQTMGACVQVIQNR